MRLRTVGLLMSLILAACVIGYSASAAIGTPGTIPGQTYTALPETGLGGPTTPARLDVGQLAVSTDEILMDGVVTYEGITLPFGLRGKPFSSRLGAEGDIVGSLRDERGNFKVVHFSIRENPGCAALTDGGRQSGRILTLYLLRENTREFTVFERPIATVTRSSIPNALELGLDQGHFGADFWHPKVFRPVRSGTIGILAEQDSDVRDYSEWYDLGNGCWVDYKISIGAYANSPSDIARGSADFNSKLEVIDKWTESNCPFYETDDSPYVLGKYADPVEVRTKTYGNDSDKGDVLLKGRYNGYYVTKTGFFDKVEIGVGVELKVASVGWSHPIGDWQDVVQDEEYIFSNYDPDHWVKTAEYLYKDRYLPDAGRYFQAIVQNAWGAGARSERTFSTRWVVPIYADYDDMSSTLYYQTTYYMYTYLTYWSG